MRQFIIENQKIKNGLIVLDGKDYKYLKQVLRVKTGDMLNVRLPSGNLQGTTVCSIDEKSKKITLQVCESLENESETITRGVQATEISKTFANCEYWLFQFIPKPQKFEQIVRQATECGVCNIVPVIGEYSEKSSVQALQNSKQERLIRIIKEARQQSGSPVDTKILPVCTLDQALTLWEEAVENQNYCGFVLSERTDDCVTIRSVLEQKKQVLKAGVCVGSEGGISPNEILKLKEKGLFNPVHFAVNILRCETAALYGVAAVQSAILEGDLCL